MKQPATSNQQPATSNQQPATSNQQLNTYFDYVDVLRGIAILGVIAIHTCQYGNFNVPAIVENILVSGERGVQLFYLTSAFTLFLSLKNRIAVEYYPVRNFFIRRFFRIAPMYYIAIVFYLFYYGFGQRYWLGDIKTVSLANIISNILFLHGFNPYWITSLVPGGWSVAVEMQFYWILPFLFSKIKDIKQAFNFFVFSIILRLSLYIILSRFNPTGSDYLWKSYLFFYLPSQLPVFSLGIIMYFIIIENKNINEISKKSLLLLSICILGQLSVGRKVFLANHILFGLGFMLLTAALSKYKCKLFINGIFIHIGKISFSMYLIHIAVLSLLRDIKCIDYANNGILNYSIRFFIVLCITIIISTISYNIIEIPFQKIGKNIIKKMETSYGGFR